MQTVKTTFVVILLLTVLYGAHAVLTQPDRKPPPEAADAARELTELQFDVGSLDDGGESASSESPRASEAPPTMSSDASPLVAPPSSSRFAGAERSLDGAEPVAPGEELAPPAPPEPGKLAPVPAIPELAPRASEVAANDGAQGFPPAPNEANNPAGDPAGGLPEAPGNTAFAPPPTTNDDVAAENRGSFAPPAAAEPAGAPLAAAAAGAAAAFGARTISAAGANSSTFTPPGGALPATPAGGAFPNLPDPGAVARSLRNEADRSLDQAGDTLDRAGQDALARAKEHTEGIRFDPKEALLSRGWKAAQESLKTGDFRQALATLSSVYEDPRLSHQERQRLLDSLDPLAARVIYSNEHLLEPAHEVRRGDTLMTVAEKYNVPWQLLRNINGIADPEFLVPGSKLKVVRGPFRADVDAATQEMTIYLQKLYAGRFPLSVGNDPAPRQGDFEVQRKDVGRQFYATNGVVLPAGDPRNPYGRCWIDLGGNVSIHGTALEAGGPTTAGCISLSPRDAEDVFAILSIGSRVTIR